MYVAQPIDGGRVSFHFSEDYCTSMGSSPALYSLISVRRPL